jgi:hypothetical protein
MSHGRSVNRKVILLWRKAAHRRRAGSLLLLFPRERDDVERAGY